MFVIGARNAVILANSDLVDKLRSRFPRSELSYDFVVAKRLLGQIRTTTVQRLNRSRQDLLDGALGFDDRHPVVHDARQV